MIKLIDLLKEMYINKQGILVGDPDFYIIDGGTKGGYFVKKEDININDYIFFESNLNNIWKNSRNISKQIYKQIIPIYKNSALFTYNKKYNPEYNPELHYTKAANNWNQPYNSFYISLTDDYSKIVIKYSLDPEVFSVSGNSFSKAFQSIFDLDKPENNDIDNRFKNIKNINPEDLESQLSFLKIKLIPNLDFVGKIFEQENIPHVFKAPNPPTKQQILELFNKIGIFLLSEVTKSKNINILDEGYVIYYIIPDFESKKYRKDGTFYDLQFLKKPYIVLCKKNQTLKDHLKNILSSSSSPPYFSLYSMLFGYEGKTEDNAEVIIYPKKPKIVKIEDIEISRILFNELKNLGLRAFDDFNKNDKIIFSSYLKNT